MEPNTKRKRIYKMEIDENADEAVFAMSLVENPAIEVDFVALSKQEKVVRLAVTDNEKRIVTGLALVPDMEIPRIDESGEEYSIYFSKDVVRKAAYSLMKNGHTKDVTLEHAEKVKPGNAYIIESWIVDNPVMDKTSSYGFNATPGSWAISMKIDDEELWQEVKLGNVKGFSLEGKFAHVLDTEVEMSKQDEYKHKLEQIKKLLLELQ